MAVENNTGFLQDALSRWQQLPDAGEIAQLWETTRSHLLQASSQLQENSQDVFNSIVACLHAPGLLKWTQALTEGAATACDKAMDANWTKRRSCMLRSK